MQPHLQTVHDDVFSPIVLMIMTLAKTLLRMVVKPKYVGKILVYILM